MGENSPQQLPAFTSLDDLVDFFDTHDMGEYEAALPEAQFDVSLKRRKHLVAIDEDVSSRLTEVAEQEQTPAESLVNSWLKEKLAGYRKPA